ncbi:MAG TPA: hypothetical protein HA224_01515 [Nanoarchaeota archaeon]|nr:hypothetical protein [Nanoarchaeota archaeon]
MTKIITKEKVLDWLVWILITITIILFLLRIFGDSPTLDQLLMGVFASVFIALYKEVIDIKGKASENSTELKYIKEQINDAKQEFKNHKHGGLK